MSEAVLDASALLALLRGEPGADEVASCLPNAAMSTVNHSEVVAKLAEAGMPREAIESALSALPIRLVDFDVRLSVAAGMLRTTTRALGLSLGDRACLALAAHLGGDAVTADSAWAKLGVGPSIRVIRHR